MATEQEIMDQMLAEQQQQQMPQQAQVVTEEDLRQALMSNVANGLVQLRNQQIQDEIQMIIQERQAELQKEIQDLDKKGKPGKQASQLPNRVIGVM